MTETWIGYVSEKGLNTKLPLVANYYGVPIIISFQDVDTAKRGVNFYAPVFEEVRWRSGLSIAEPNDGVLDYQ